MKLLNTSLAVVMICTLLSCQKGDNPYISKSEVDKIDSLRHPSIRNVSFIYQGEIYLLEEFDSKPVKITSDGGQKKWLKMSHDHTKFAYQSNDFNVRVVNKEGKIISDIAGNDIRNFDWSADDKTLWVVDGDQVKFSGPTIKVPAFISYQSYFTFINGAISRNGDVIYLLKKSNFSAADQYMIVTRKATGGDPVFYKPEQEDSSLPPPVSVDFGSNGLDAMVGFSSSRKREALTKVYLFQGLGQYPVNKLGFRSASSPAYVAESKYFLIAKDIDDTSNRYIYGTYLFDDVADNDKVLSDYPGVQFMDWK